MSSSIKSMMNAIVDSNKNVFRVILMTEDYHGKKRNPKRYTVVLQYRHSDDTTVPEDIMYGETPTKALESTCKFLGLEV